MFYRTVVVVCDGVDGQGQRDLMVGSKIMLAGYYRLQPSISSTGNRLPLISECTSIEDLDAREPLFHRSMELGNMASRSET